MPPRLRLPRPPSSRLSSNIWCRSTECGRVRGLCRAFDRPDIAEVTPNSAEALAKGWPECGSPAQKSMQLPPAGFPTFGSENATAVQSGDGDGAAAHVEVDVREAPLNGAQDLVADAEKGHGGELGGQHETPGDVIVRAGRVRGPGSRGACGGDRRRCGC